MKRGVFRLAARLVSLAALLGSSVFLDVTPAQASIVERVVAVVGERPLLLTELRTRARPFLKQLAGAPPGQRAAAEAQLFSTLLERMVDEELLRRAAAGARITVTAEEVDAAIERVANGNEVTKEELLAEVARSGVSQGEYRKEIHRQLLDAKVMNLRLQGRIRISDQEVQQQYDTVAAAERDTLPVRVAALRLLIPPDATPAAVAAIKKQALSVVRQARAGADFAALVRANSTDPDAAQSGGELPMLPPSQMADELSQAISELAPGEVSQPVRSGDTLVVLKLLERTESQLPPLERLRPQLEQRVQMSKMEKARESWLKSLRKTTHVEMRL